MQSTRNKLIKLLAASKDDYISGQLLSEKLNISRSAIWKHMEKLKKDGYEIEGKSNQGYRMIRLPDKLSENTVQWGLNTQWIGKSIIHKTSTPSTQIIAHQAAQNDALHGTVVIADEQTSGRGRMSRQWHSTKQKGIWLSLVLRPNISPYLAPQLTLLTATVLADVIYSVTKIRPQIKWPNDILMHSKKTAGILTEMQAEQDQIQYVVIGMGINVNQAKNDFPDIIQTKATSLKIETNQTWDIVKLIQEILVTFEQSYDTYIKNGFPHIKNKWESYGFKIGKTIWVKTLQEEFKAIFSGIAEDGALLIKTMQGETKQLYSGEINWFQKEE
ncbi:biotin--[acetyl-CoA-carboxylase] ligase [Virgibacillus alimentarius]|uniref:Bifunctional ligase/repressor BirA n=1 Tax=Virgibacillus alimentarius TaxID=698769 RepID=A0ABS4S4M6_9BACI|nr:MULTISPECIES: biotin--[acetyl-CoA-carboxylase] ligase [Virgibacillus]MBP2256359.1 BirA family biotin operon repressor/biotin-[acetyl-CoA-carboxylase] ligase [Virgibacillus alimentarius]HLR66304.1 biotin--[acetyl-CoA-carboxylase] ligase [Virgibacillus sp.]